MHRPTLLAGLAAIALMCLFPPVKTGAGGVVAAMMSGEEAAAVEYRPLWALTEDIGEESPLFSFKAGSVAWSRLVLQLLIAAVVTGGVSYYFGTQSPSEP